jgi:hypothetical protein
VLDGHVRKQPALLRVEGSDQYAKLIRRPYLMAVNTAAWLHNNSEEDVLVSGQESGDLIVWSIKGTRTLPTNNLKS